MLQKTTAFRGPLFPTNYLTCVARLGSFLVWEREHSFTGLHPQSQTGFDFRSLWITSMFTAMTLMALVAANPEPYDGTPSWKLPEGTVVIVTGKVIDWDFPAEVRIHG